MSIFKQPNLQTLEPISVPWPMKDVSTSKTQLEIFPGGLKQMINQHELLRGVTPAMLLHWFTHLLVDELTIDGKKYPAYRVWHPKDHVSVGIEKKIK